MLSNLTCHSLWGVLVDGNVGELEELGISLWSSTTSLVGGVSSLAYSSTSTYKPFKWASPSHTFHVSFSSTIASLEISNLLVLRFNNLYYLDSSQYAIKWYFSHFKLNFTLFQDGIWAYVINQKILKLLTLSFLLCQVSYDFLFWINCLGRASIENLDHGMYHFHPKFIWVVFVC